MPSDFVRREVCPPQIATVFSKQTACMRNSKGQNCSVNIRGFVHPGVANKVCTISGDVLHHFTTAATLFKAGKTDIKSATDAEEAPRPLAGNGARMRLDLGLIGA